MFVSVEGRTLRIADSSDSPSGISPMQVSAKILLGMGPEKLFLGLHPPTSSVLRSPGLPTLHVREVRARMGSPLDVGRDRDKNRRRGRERASVA
jgi:hypothetical protein